MNTVTVVASYFCGFLQDIVCDCSHFSKMVMLLVAVVHYSFFFIVCYQFVTIFSTCLSMLSR